MLTAEYGGSGGQPIETGLCVEEPDIEIGAGVSSKAISRRMQTDRGGSNGPKSTRGRDGGREDEQNGGRFRRGRDGPGEQQQQQQQQAAAGGGASAGPQGGMGAFPFGIGTLPNGMPSFPDGFSFPDPTQGGQKWGP